jgi:hypothetical protein
MEAQNSIACCIKGGYQEACGHTRNVKGGYQEACGHMGSIKGRYYKNVWTHTECQGGVLRSMWTHVECQGRIPRSMWIHTEHQRRILQSVWTHTVLRSEHSPQSGRIRDAPIGPACPIPLRGHGLSPFRAIPQTTRTLVSTSFVASLHLSFP